MHFLAGKQACYQHRRPAPGTLAVFIWTLPSARVHLPSAARTPRQPSTARMSILRSLYQFITVHVTRSARLGLQQGNHYTRSLSTLKWIHLNIKLPERLLNSREF